MKKLWGDFLKDPKAFIWFYSVAVACRILGHKPDDVFGLFMHPVCMRCGADQFDGEWKPRK